jgi:cysteine-rich repeat protein
MVSRYAKQQPLWAVTLTVLATASACDVFDESLEGRLDDGSDDASVDQGGTFALSDSCSGAIPEVASNETVMTLAVTNLSSSSAESGDCSVAPDVLSKADGFFQVQARAGQRWHFHLDPAPNENLSVFASASCDLRECVAAADVCGVNESEHFTFVAQQAGTYVVVLDGIDPNGGDLRLLAVSPECSDGRKVHGEGCDDGNQLRGDGCDDACRVELSGGTVEEVEPNDDTYLANVVTADLSAPVQVNGRVGGNSCQPDYFLIRVPAAGLLSVRVRGGAGTECINAPLTDLALLSADQFELRDGAVLAHQAGSNGGCPELMQTVTPGTYFLRLSRLAAAAQFEYQLQLALSTEAPAI